MINDAINYVKGMPNNAKKYYARSYLAWKLNDAPSSSPTEPEWGMVSPLKAHEIRLKIDRLLEEK